MRGFTAVDDSPALSLAELEAFDPDAPAGGHERRFLCPLCGDNHLRDREHRSLSLAVDTGLWTCHRCRAGGKLKEHWQPRRDASRAALRRRFGLGSSSSLTRTLIGQKSQPGAIAGHTERPAPAGASTGDWLQRWERARPLAGTPGAAYLQARAIAEGLATEAGCRYAGDWYGRPAVLFPITNKAGELVAVHGRYLDAGTPKARTAGDLKRGIFTTPGALAASLIVITEAPIDALSLAAAGFPALALIGTSWPQWLRVAAGLKVGAVALDADPAGDAAASKLSADLTSLGAHVTRWRPEGGKDWNECAQAGAGLPCWWCAQYAARSYVAAASMIDGRPACDAHGGRRRHGHVLAS